MADIAAPTEVRLDAVGVVVSDMARSARFYRAVGVEGLPLDPGDEQHVEGRLAGGTRLMLDTEELIRGIDAEWAPGGSGRVSLAVQCPSPAAVDELYVQLAAEGLGHRAPWDAFWGQRYASVRDPDGTPVDLYAPLADQEARP